MLDAYPVYSVAGFVNLLRTQLQHTVGRCLIEGEITNLRTARDTLVYFELKDDVSRFLCFLPRAELPFPLGDGMAVRVLGYPSVFKGSGGLYLRVEDVTLLGAGALAQAFARLRTKLDAEGLFDPERKRPLPAFPQRIGLVTSPDAAAYTDVLRVLQQRWPGLSVLLCPVPVQGAGAAKAIQQAVQYLGRLRDLDVLLLVRGGGSIEDLQAFNDERVARAIFASSIPIVTGVGHERDWTIADFVADARGATPSHAAELVVAEKMAVAQNIRQCVMRMRTNLDHALHGQRTLLHQHVWHMRMRLGAEGSKTAHLQLRMARAFETWYALYRARNVIVQTTAARLYRAFLGLLFLQKQRLTDRARMLVALSPRAVLDRGYSITHFRGKAVREAQNVPAGALLDTELAQGHIASVVRDA